MPFLLFLFPAGLALLILAYARQSAAAMGSSSSGGYGGPAPPDFVGGDFDEFGNAIDRQHVALLPPALELEAFSAGVAPINWLAPTIPSSSSSSSSSSSWQPPPAASSYLERIAQAEARYGIPSNLLARMLQEESSFNPLAIGPPTRTGERAQGIAQFMPSTARDFGIDPLVPNMAIDASGKYLRQLYDQSGDWRLALTAYNWGIGNLTRQGANKAPAETRRYVDRITRDVPV